MKTKVLIYCTKGELLQAHWGICNNGIDKHILYGRKCKDKDFLSPHTENGKIVAECEVECEEIMFLPDIEQVNKHRCYQCRFEDEQKRGYDKEDYSDYYLEGSDDNCIVFYSCVKSSELHSYLKGKNGYALHISKLKIFDEPLRLIEVEHKKVIWGNEIGFALEKAPQNMMWVWYKGEGYCLISIRPEWVCKILNGEKTIEVRKKVLKGMYEETL